MPETIGNEHPVSRPAHNRSECTAAKCFEDAEKMIAEVDRLGAEEFNPQNLFRRRQPDERLHLGKSLSPAPNTARTPDNLAKTSPKRASFCRRVCDRNYFIN